MTVENDVVTKLYFNYQSLTTIPDSIRNLTNLTYLNLYDNKLTSIPEWIGNLTNLTTLDLRRNNLKSITGWIGNLTNLEYLHLAYNQLTGTIPSEIGNLTLLTSLHLEGNHLEGEVPASIKNLTRTGLFNAFITNYINLGGNRLFTNDPSVKAFLDSKHENGNFEACQWSSRVLTQADHTLEVKNHEFIQVYGASSGSNEIHVEEYGTIKFMHALGHNTIVLDGNPEYFKVWRSGATVYIATKWRTQISIPATTTEQTIRFEWWKANKSFALRIENGKVMLNSQVLTAFLAEMIRMTNSWS